MRGEHFAPHSIALGSSGSSPHARGARAGRARQAKQEGIIPACAGSTRRARRQGPSAGDHPRMRGEHSPHPMGSRMSRGSSPHARGAPQKRHGQDKDHGIIPACAGSTTPPRTRRARSRDHPRMRGEHDLARAVKNVTSGSSPHARGALVEHVFAARQIGIIPACAGSTISKRREHEVRRDHPRMRGEHYMPAKLSVCA